MWIYVQDGERCLRVPKREGLFDDQRVTSACGRTVFGENVQICLKNDGENVKNLIEKDKYPDIKYGIKLGNKNIGFNGEFYTFPYFLTFLLKRFLSKVASR